MVTDPHRRVAGEEQVAAAGWPGLHADGPTDFVIDPLPNLLFTRDSSLWIGDRVGVTSLAMPARRRETTLTDAIYRHHPRFAGTEFVYRPDLEHLEGGDVLLLAPGVLAVGVGERTTPAGAERLGRQVFAAGLAHTILVVPIAQERATMHLDTVCTMVDVDAVLMYPNIADTLSAYTVIAGGRRRGPAGGRPGAVPARPPPTRWTSTCSGSSTPGWTRSPPNASSGTTATTPSRWPPGSASATSATPRPTPAGAGRHRGDPRSPAPSWAPAAAARAACPARSPATRSRTSRQNAVQAARADFWAEGGPTGSAQGELAAEQPRRARRSAAVSGSVTGAPRRSRLANCGHRLLPVLGRGVLRQVPDRHDDRARGTCRRTWSARRA